MHCIESMCMRQRAAGPAVEDGCTFCRRKRIARGTSWKRRYSEPRRRLPKRAPQRALSCSAMRMASRCRWRSAGSLNCLRRSLARRSRPRRASRRRMRCVDIVLHLVPLQHCCVWKRVFRACCRAACMLELLGLFAGVYWLMWSFLAPNSLLLPANSSTPLHVHEKGIAARPKMDTAD